MNIGFDCQYVQKDNAKGVARKESKDKSAFVVVPRRDNQSAESSIKGISEIETCNSFCFISYSASPHLIFYPYLSLHEQNAKWHVLFFPPPHPLDTHTHKFNLYLVAFLFELKMPSMQCDTTSSYLRNAWTIH